MSLRKLYIIGDVDAASFSNFCEELDLLEQESNKDIIIELSSPGGLSMDALAFCGRMRLSSCNLIVKAYGLVGSAAVLLLAAGDKRLMAKESWLMVHEDQDEVSGNVSEFEKLSVRMRMFENQWAMLLEEHTGTNASVWAELHKKDVYIPAYDCLSLGIIDEVI